ncbi:MAG: hypothetical protein CMJ51_00605 [Planctomycetaceae bacterium]|nr:hypothetical protein [Planctomycetaceae bacterium]
MIQMLAMTASMILVGWIVWKVINRHEDGDEVLQSRLDADDRRAALGRGERVPEESSVED